MITCEARIEARDPVVENEQGASSGTKEVRPFLFYILHTMYYVFFTI